MAARLRFRIRLLDVLVFVTFAPCLSFSGYTEKAQIKQKGKVFSLPSIYGQRRKIMRAARPFPPGRLRVGPRCVLIYKYNIGEESNYVLFENIIQSFRKLRMTSLRPDSSTPKPPSSPRRSMTVVTSSGSRLTYSFGSESLLTIPSSSSI